jgi:DNA-3-methyladenine glycosylase II
MIPAKLDSPEALKRHLKALLRRDPRLVAVAERAGPFELRVVPRGFAGMARIVCGQQLSVASARAIWSRFEQLPGALAAESYLRLEEALVRGAGFSAGKHRTMTALAHAVLSGSLDFEALHAVPADQAIAALTQVKGVGPWTAELYLLFSAAHPDIFPVGDLALRKAVGHGLGLAEPPEPAMVGEIASAWAPHRATAALLFWRYFAALRDRDGVIL